MARPFEPALIEKAKAKVLSAIAKKPKKPKELEELASANLPKGAILRAISALVSAKQAKKVGSTRAMVVQKVA